MPSYSDCIENMTRDNCDKPLVSIITVTFNLIENERSSCFRKCLESVRKQTYANFEHLVIDGASTDNSTDLINEYAGLGWIKYISEPDSGIYDAMNKGILISKGKYLVFLNSDDFFHDRKGIEKSVKALEDSNADFSYAPANMLNIDGTIKENHPHNSPKITNVFFLMPFCHQTMFVKKTVLIKEGMFDTQFKSAGDYDFVLRLCLKNYKSIYVDNKFVSYSLGGVSITDNQSSRNEVAELYYKNFSTLCSITKEECQLIYCSYNLNIPAKLAIILNKVSIYFDLSEYLKVTRKENKLLFYLFWFIQFLRTWFLQRHGISIK